MTRSPLFYPLQRGTDPEPGGAADLQTDVMRFMAILSLCLVAIFALVQSIPLSPPTPNETISNGVPEHQVAVPTRSEPPPASAEPAVKSVRPVTQDSVRRVPNDGPTARTLQRPKPSRRISAQQTANSDAEPDDKPPVQGLILRFASDEALAKLVATRVVAVYALSDKAPLRLRIDDGRMAFWPASTPSRYHEMDLSTVPEAIRAALPPDYPANAGWGVTLPPDISAALADHFARHRTGELIIAADGSVELRQ